VLGRWSDKKEIKDSWKPVWELQNEFHRCSLKCDIMYLMLNSEVRDEDL